MRPVLCAVYRLWLPTVLNPPRYEPATELATEGARPCPPLAQSLAQCPCMPQRKHAPGGSRGRGLRLGWRLRLGLLWCRLLGLGVPSLRRWPCRCPSGVGGRRLAVPVDHLPHRLHKRIALPNGVLRFEPGVQGLDELLLPEPGVLPRSYFGELPLRQGWTFGSWSSRMRASSRRISACSAVSFGSCGSCD